MDKKIGCMTFHASHNYGSNLQAYALQEFIKKNGEYDYKIINFRTQRQKDFFKLVYDKKGLKNNLKALLYLKYKKDLKIKYEKFEDFINNRLDITEEVNEKEISKFDGKFDYYIVGSDQIWNLAPLDFDWAYYLDFVKKGKKFSYAASFGPKSQTWNSNEKAKVKKLLSEFDSISVREEGSFNNVKDVVGVEPCIHVDPVLLLDKNEWKKIISKKIFQNGEYIFLYDLKAKKETYIIAKEISKKLKMPVVICAENTKNIFTSFIKRFDAGTYDFLNLIQNSKLVLSTSFHGTVFPIVLNKPFFAINGKEDYRINTLLKTFKLEDRSIELNDFKNKIKNYNKINFCQANKVLENERKKSKEYLLRALGEKV